MKYNITSVDTQTKTVRTKDVYKRTFIFGSIWKHGKTFESESLMNVTFGTSQRRLFQVPRFFLPHLEIY